MTRVLFGFKVDSDELRRVGLVLVVPEAVGATIWY